MIGGAVGEIVDATTAMRVAAFGFASISVAFLVRPRLRQILAVESANRSDFAIGFTEQ